MSSLVKERLYCEAALKALIRDQMCGFFSFHVRSSIVQRRNFEIIPGQVLTDPLIRFWI